MTTFTAFTDAQWEEIQAARADWPTDINWEMVRQSLEQAGRDFWMMRANRRRHRPKLRRRRLQSALERVRPLGHKRIESALENQLAIYEAWSSQHFKGHRDAHRELLYLRVIQQWTGRLQGELKFSEAGTGPAVRFLLATLVAVLGDKAPRPAGIARIIEKERQRREDVHLYFKRKK